MGDEVDIYSDMFSPPPTPTKQSSKAKQLANGAGKWAILFDRIYFNKQ